MIHAAYALPDEQEPADGDELASTLGWSHWSDYVAARHDHYRAAAQLALWHWSNYPADLEHELEQLLHDCDDEDLTAVTAQVLAALRAMPEGATFYATDGEPAGDEDLEESIDTDPLAVLSEARTARKDGETWQVGSNWYTKRNGKIVKTSDPSKRALNQSKVRTRTAQRAAVKSAADKLAAGGKDLTHEDVVALDDHFAALPRDQMREIARKIGAKVGGLKAQLAERLIAEAKARVAAGPRPAPEPPAPEPPPEPPPAHPATSKLIGALNASPGLSDEQREHYGRSMARVIRSMPKEALDRVHAHTAGATFYEKSEEIGPAVLEVMATQPGLTPDQSADIRRRYASQLGSDVGGCYLSLGSGSTLHLDGQQQYEKRDSGRYPNAGADLKTSTHAVYAHELAHAIDGPKHGPQRISSTPEWAEAYRDEIQFTDDDSRAKATPKLSGYAGYKVGPKGLLPVPNEGWAEFGRLVYGSDVPHAEIEKNFPKCTKVWKDRGLWPAGDQLRGEQGGRKEAVDRRGGPSALDELFSHSVPLDDAGDSHADILLDPTDPAAVAYALALLRAEGTDEADHAAAELLHMIGDSDVEEPDTSESVAREERGPPPFAGAIFDTTSHRWKLPAHDATDHTGAHPAETKAKSLAARIKEVPGAVAKRVSGWVANKYKTLSDRYGPTGAKAVLGAMVLLSPVPVPGTSLVPIALAEAVLRVRRAVAGATESAEPDLSVDEVERIARELLEDLDAEMRSS